MVKFINMILEYPIISAILVPIIITVVYDVIKHKFINKKKDEAGRKLIDKYVPTVQEKKNYSYDLKNYYSGKAWNNVGQICFTVFIEDKYVSGTTGTFEVSNCFLELGK